MTIHKEGTASITISLLFSAIIIGSSLYFFPDSCWLHYISYTISAFIIVIILQFFRKPVRKTTIHPDYITSPADGKVVVIEEVFEPEYFNERKIQVSVFMSPFNVHINHYPVSGVVKYAKYHAGKYLVAWHPKSSTENERTSIVIENDKKTEVLIRQIAGAMARRIVYYCKVGDKAKQGAEVGFIKFGSRVDIFLPLDAKVKVKLNQKVTGAESIIAEL
jgi:phosphatidylserine decarboxylase